MCSVNVGIGCTLPHTRSFEPGSREQPFTEILFFDFLVFIHIEVVLVIRKLFFVFYILFTGFYVYYILVTFVCMRICLRAGRNEYRMIYL